MSLPGDNPARRREGGVCMPQRDGLGTSPACSSISDSDRTHLSCQSPIRSALLRELCRLRVCVSQLATLAVPSLQGKETSKCEILAGITHIWCKTPSIRGNTSYKHKYKGTVLHSGGRVRSPLCPGCELAPHSRGGTSSASPLCWAHLPPASPCLWPPGERD